MQTQEETILALQELVKSYAQTIDSLSMQISQGNSSIKDELATDQEYKKIDDEIKALQKRRKQIKEDALLRKNLIQTQEKIKDLRKEKKEKKNDLSEYLLELQKQANVERVQLSDGVKWIIKKNAKLIKPPKAQRILDEMEQT